MLRVLTYHRIVPHADDPATTPGIASATAERFERQVRFVAREFEPVGLRDVLDACGNGGRLPARALLVTFDDAYRDFATLAWPILQRNRVPATLFVPTAYVGCVGPVFWWDRLYHSLMRTSQRTLAVETVGAFALRTLAERRAAFTSIRNRMKALMHDDAMRLVDAVCEAVGEPLEQIESSVLSWDALRSLASAGVDLASHTHTHPLLNRVSPERVQQEIELSQRALQAELGTAPPVLSFPNGAHDDDAVEIARRAGIVLGFTQLPGHNVLADCDFLRLRRINVTRRTSVPLLRLRLQRWFAPLERWRKRKRILAYQSRPASALARPMHVHAGSTPPG